VNAGQLYRLARVLREIAQLATLNPGEHAPSASTLAVVEDVHEHPGTAIKDIVRRTGLAQSVVSRTVGQLHHAGALGIAKNPADGRSTLVSLNPKTRRDFVNRGERPLPAALAQLAPDLTTEQQSRIEAALEVLATELLAAPPL
jgi:DNA-binding MarR family transcriptional regulator